jgi:hypothetical protein
MKRARRLPGPRLPALGVKRGISSTSKVRRYVEPEEDQQARIPDGFRALPGGDSCYRRAASR